MGLAERPGDSLPAQLCVPASSLLRAPSLQQPSFCFSRLQQKLPETAVPGVPAPALATPLATTLAWLAALLPQAKEGPQQQGKQEAAAGAQRLVGVLVALAVEA